MNERFIGLCLDELKVFYDSLKDDNVPDVPAISEELLTEAKEISKSCMLLGSYKSCRTPDIFTQPDFVYFTKEINIKKKDKECQMEKSQEPANDENANEKMEPQKGSKRKDQEYQTFVWGSNASGIHVSLIHFWRWCSTFGWGKTWQYCQKLSRNHWCSAKRKVSIQVKWFCGNFWMTTPSIGMTHLTLEKWQQ